MAVRPGYKQTEIGVIPEDWATVHLPDVVWYQEGPGVRNHQFTNAGVKLLNGTNIENGRIFLDKTSRYVSEREAYGWYSHFLADAGDIVIACSGITVSRFDEKVSVLCSEHLPLCMNTSTMRFKIASPRIHKDYFRHFLRSQIFKDQIGGTATGSAQLNFGPAHVSAAVVPLPAKSEQEAIAEALSDADAVIEALEHLLAKKRQIKQGAMQELLTGKKRLPGFSGPWDIRELRDICVKIQDGTHFSPRLGGSDFLYVTSKNIGYGVLDVSTAGRISAGQHAKIYARCDVTKGDLLLTKDGVNAGNAALNTLDDPISLLSSVAMLRFDRHRHAAAYFLYQILSPDGQQQVRELVSGNAITRLTLLKIRLLRLPVATLAEQTAIAAVLLDMDAELVVLEAKLAKARQLKLGMMQELLTGRIRLV
jgi:restriction endonuclease S subunit